MDEKANELNHASDLREKRAVSESVEEMSIIDQDSELLAAYVFTNIVYVLRFFSPAKKADNGSESEDDSKKSKPRAAGPLEIVILRTVTPLSCSQTRNGTQKLCTIRAWSTYILRLQRLTLLVRVFLV